MPSTCSLRTVDCQTLWYALYFSLFAQVTLALPELACLRCSFWVTPHGPRRPRIADQSLCVIDRTQGT